MFGFIILVRRPAVEYTARTKLFVEFREVLLGGPVWEFGFLFSVEMVQIAEKLIESVDSW